MKRFSGAIVSGEKIALITEQRDTKTFVNLHILIGVESMKLSVRDGQLLKQLQDLPERKPVKLEIEVQTYKDELYFQALKIIA